MDLHPKVYKNFISDEQRLSLNNYATTLFEQKRFYPNKNPRRYFLTLKRNPRVDNNGLYYTKEINSLFTRISDTLDLSQPIVDPVIGVIISYMEPGAFIHKHKDLYNSAKYANNDNYRFNIMVNRNYDNSYNPIINDISYDVLNCDAWCFNATQCAHQTLPITGPEPRIVYQFGFLIPKQS